MGTTVVDTYTRDVNLLMLPAWFHDSGDGLSMGTAFTAAHDWDIGYQFDVSVNHLDIGFSTPNDWVFRIPGISEPLFDLANKRTGFKVNSLFQIVSRPNGLVNTSDYQFNLLAEVLDEKVFERTFGFSVNDTLPLRPTQIAGACRGIGQLLRRVDSALQQ